MGDSEVGQLTSIRIISPEELEDEDENNDNEDSDDLLILVAGYREDAMAHFIDPEEAWPIDDISLLTKGERVSVIHKGVELVFQLDPEDERTLMLVGGNANHHRELIIPNGLLYKDERFFPLEKIDDFAFERPRHSLDGVKKIEFTSTYSWSLTAGQNCFGNALHLETIILPVNLMNISYCMFEKCPRLKNVVIPKETLLTEIESFAFMDCHSLTTFTIPSEVEKIGEGPWRNCFALESIEVSEDNEFFFSREGVLYTDNLPQTLVQYPAGKKDESYDVLYGTEYIGNSAFYGNQFLEKVSFPASLREISHIAFCGCSKLKDVVFNGDNLYFIGNGAFRDCSSLKEITLYGDLKYTHNNDSYYDTFPKSTTVKTEASIPAITFPNSSTGPLSAAWELINGMPRMLFMDIKDYQEYGFPPFLGKGKTIAAYGIAYLKEDILRILQGIPDKFLVYSKTDEKGRITRYYLDIENSKSPKVLYTFIGIDGNELDVTLFENGNTPKIKSYLKSLNSTK